MSKAELTGFSVTVSLPDNFGEGYDFTVTHHYSIGHAWAGQVSHTTEHNEAHDTLWKETSYSEASHHPWGQWAKYDLDAESPAEIQQEVEQLVAKINDVIARFPPKKRRTNDGCH